MARSVAHDYDKKRHHILTVATKIFAAEGFARASMSQIAKSGKISKANIYHYYESKDELLFDTLNTYLMGLRERLASIDLTDHNPEKKLQLLVTDIMLAYEGMDAQHKIQIESLHHLPKNQQNILKEIQRDIVSLFRGVLEEVVMQDDRQDLMTTQYNVMSLFGMVNWFYQWNGKASRSERRAYADRVCDILLNGIVNSAVR